MVTIFGMNQIQAVPSHELFRQISEKSGGGRTSVQDFAPGVDQRDRIGAVFDERPKALERCSHSSTSLFLKPPGGTYLASHGPNQLAPGCCYTRSIALPAAETYFRVFVPASTECHVTKCGHAKCDFATLAYFWIEVNVHGGSPSVGGSKGHSTFVSVAHNRLLTA